MDRLRSEPVPQVDDLKEGKGAEYIEASIVCLVFVSGGYFKSQNCMRELLYALARGKPLLTLTESEWKHGAMSRDEVRAELKEADEVYLARWGDACLAMEIEKWLTRDDLHPEGRRLCSALVDGTPIADDVEAAIFSCGSRLSPRGSLGDLLEPIEWNRIGAPHPCHGDTSAFRRWF